MTTHAIRYRRPETPWSLSRMTTQNAKDAAHQVERLIALGYAVADVTPPIEGWMPASADAPAATAASADATSGEAPAPG